MQPFTRGLIAVTVAVTATVSALAIASPPAALTAASATSAVPADASAASPTAAASTTSLGPQSSANGTASVSGRITAAGGTPPGRLEISGRLSNRDTRAAKRGGTCAHLEVRLTYAPEAGHDAPEVVVDRVCRPGETAEFSYERKGVTRVETRVCVSSPVSSTPSRCGDWRTAYAV
ncbi:hypothetical protein FHS43_000123 [Streptosporangium becharense]|uniref:Subtilisin inhibitor domain-containing protein n=1 Tax=Streptosporangium becharense TaxID=1816182 RepID=A0A7W9MGR0_9ACTN|nr:hypothetical protein [Streptosporangium becharense]MBB2908877.1 hypothetical protein [Streptosporangium becharense]MBB5820105.1 hypothetical protein [Streptosporangium becharense]